MFQQIFLCGSNLCQELGYKCLPLFCRWGVVFQCSVLLIIISVMAICCGLGVFLPKQLMTLGLKCLIFHLKVSFTYQYCWVYVITLLLLILGIDGEILPVSMCQDPIFLLLPFLSVFLLGFCNLLMHRGECCMAKKRELVQSKYIGQCL